MFSIMHLSENAAGEACGAQIQHMRIAKGLGYVYHQTAGN